MDRNETIRISRLAAFGGLSFTDASKLLMEYCTVDHNKSVDDTNKLISALLHNQILLSFYVQTALEYYERKFMVYKLYSKEPERTLLQIF